MRWFELDLVLGVRLGPAEREVPARIQYRAGHWYADVDRIEVLMPSGCWASAPWLLELLADSAPLYDALRAHAAGRRMDSYETAAALRDGPA